MGAKTVRKFGKDNHVLYDLKNVYDFHESDLGLLDVKKTVLSDNTIQKGRIMTEGIKKKFAHLIDLPVVTDPKVFTFIEGASRTISNTTCILSLQCPSRCRARRSCT